MLTFMEHQKIHPIRYVVNQTGLTHHVIRAWEKRYGVVCPDRTPTNRRLYSDADIRRLRQLRQAVEAGHSISRLAGLSTDSLALLAPDGNALSAESAAPNSGLSGDVSVAALLKDGLAAVCGLDADALESTLTRAAVHLTRAVTLEGVILPLLRIIGDRWATGNLKIVNEHMATAVIGSFLRDLLRDTETPPNSPKILVATPVGQWHEMGALATAVTAADCGWAAHYFGPNLPAEEIAAAAGHLRVRAVALSIVYVAGSSRLARELKKLRRCLDGSIPLVIGGNATGTLNEVCTAIGAFLPSTFQEFRQELDALLRTA